jgi:hypothetical protein
MIGQTFSDDFGTENYANHTIIGEGFKFDSIQTTEILL